MLFFTPLLVLFAWHTLVNANLQWAKKESYSSSLYQGDSKEKNNLDEA